NTDAVDVVVRVFLRDRLVPEDAVGEAGVGEFVPADVVEFLGAVGRAHAVDLCDDEAEVGQGIAGAKRLGHERALRAGVNVLDDRVALRRVEVPRPGDDPPNAGRAVAALGDEHLRRLPAAGLQVGYVRPLQLADERAVVAPPQLVYRRHVHPRIGVDDVLA